MECNSKIFFISDYTPNDILYSSADVLKIILILLHNQYKIKMLYFKTIPFSDGIKQPQIETALRKFALKKNSSLDFASSTLNIGTDKIFFGFEGRTTLQFTRIRTSFEFMLPKLILSVSKDPLAATYKLRLSAIPFAICLLIAFGIFTIILALLRGLANAEGVIVISVVAILFLLLLTIEIKLTRSRVAKVIKNALLVPQI